MDQCNCSHVAISTTCISNCQYSSKACMTTKIPSNMLQSTPPYRNLPECPCIFHGHSHKVALRNTKANDVVRYTDFRTCTQKGCKKQFLEERYTSLMTRRCYCRPLLAVYQYYDIIHTPFTAAIVHISTLTYRRFIMSPIPQLICYDIIYTV